MQTFDHSAVSAAPPEEVWKLLYDPTQFPRWWAGTGSVETSGDVGDYTMYPEGYPDFPMPQALTTSRENGAVTISCLVSDLCFGWRLRPLGSGTEISVHVEIPDHEAHRLDAQREIIGQSVRKLAELAAVDRLLAPGAYGSSDPYFNNFKQVACLVGSWGRVRERGSCDGRPRAYDPLSGIGGEGA